MKNVINKMLDHPFGTAFLISAVTDGIVKIVMVARGKTPNPSGIIINKTIEPDAK